MFLIPKQCLLHHTVDFKYSHVTISDKYNSILCIKDNWLYFGDLQQFLQSLRKPVPFEFKKIVECQEYAFRDGKVYFVQNNSIYKTALSQLLDKKFQFVENGSHVRLICDKIVRLGDEKGKLPNITLNVDSKIQFTSDHLYILQKTGIVIKTKEFETVATIDIANIQDFRIHGDLIILSIFEDYLCLRYSKINGLEFEWTDLDDELFDEIMEPPQHALLCTTVYNKLLLVVGRNTAGDINFFLYENDTFSRLKLQEDVATPLDKDHLPLGSEKFYISFAPTINVPSQTPDIDPEDIKNPPIFIYYGKQTLCAYFLLSNFHKSCPETVTFTSLHSIPLESPQKDSKLPIRQNNQESMPQSDFKTQDLNFQSFSKKEPVKEPIKEPVKEPVKELAKVVEKPVATESLVKEIKVSSPIKDFSQLIQPSEYSEAIIKLVNDFNNDLASLVIPDLPPKPSSTDLSDQLNHAIFHLKEIEKLQLKSSDSHNSLALMVKQIHRLQLLDNSFKYKQPNDFIFKQLTEELNFLINHLKLTVSSLDASKSQTDPVNIQSLFSKCRSLSISLQQHINALEEDIATCLSSIVPTVVAPNRIIKPIKSVTKQSIYSPFKSPNSPKKKYEIKQEESPSPLANKSKKVEFKLDSNNPKEQEQTSTTMQQKPAEFNKNKKDVEKTNEPPKKLDLLSSVNKESPQPVKVAIEPLKETVITPQTFSFNTLNVSNTEVKTENKDVKEPEAIKETVETTKMDGMEMDDKSSPQTFPTPSINTAPIAQPTFGQTGGFGTPSALGYTPQAVNFQSGGFAKYSQPQQSSGFGQQQGGFPQQQQQGGFPQQQNPFTAQAQQGNDIFGNSNQPYFLFI